MADIGESIKRRRVIPLEAEPKADPGEPTPRVIPESVPSAPKKEPV